MIQRWRFFDVTWDAARHRRGMHFRVQLDRRRNHKHVELRVTRLEHLAVIGKDPHAPRRKMPGVLLAGETRKIRIARADQPRVPAFLESRDRVVMRTGESAKADDANA